MKEAWNSGAGLGETSLESPAVSWGKTLHCLAPFGRSFHSKVARCFGMFQSSYRHSQLSEATWSEERRALLCLPLYIVCFCET